MNKDAIIPLLFSTFKSVPFHFNEMVFRKMYVKKYVSY